MEIPPQKPKCCWREAGPSATSRPRSLSLTTFPFPLLWQRGSHCCQQKPRMMQFPWVLPASVGPSPSSASKLISNTLQWHARVSCETGWASTILCLPCMSTQRKGEPEVCKTILAKGGGAGSLTPCVCSFSEVLATHFQTHKWIEIWVSV